MCADQRTQFMSEEVSQEFRDLLQLCSNQLYLDEDGMVQESSINGNLHVAFENGYLTHSLDEATMIEKITMGEDYMSMTITSRQETSISYSFEATYPDLSDYTKGEL